jgi:hypothetical protein
MRARRFDCVLRCTYANATETSATASANKLQAITQMSTVLMVSAFGADIKVAAMGKRSVCALTCTSLETNHRGGEGKRRLCGFDVQ